jgi:hypothetical protein
MAKTLLAVNTLTEVNNQVYASHMNAAFRMGKDCPEDDFLLLNGYRMSIDRFRNNAAKIALQNECDYLWFIDDDNIIPPHTYKQLKDRNVDVVTPVTYIRSYPFKPMFFKTILSASGEVAGLTHYDGFEKMECEDNLLPVAAIGFSCCLIKVDILRKIPPAWFVTSTHQTEDVYFCIKARQTLENNISICVDRNIAVGHQMDPDFVHPVTRDALLAYYETINPELKNSRKGDNSATYLAEQQRQLDNIEFQMHDLSQKGVEFVNEA